MRLLSVVESRFAARHLDSCRAWRFLVAAVGADRAGVFLKSRSDKPFAKGTLAWLPRRPQGRG